MGSDIHAVIEYEREGCPAVGWGKVFIERDHDLFKALAFAEQADGESMRFPPRGLPANLSHESLEEFVRESSVVGYLASPRVLSFPEAEAILREDLHTPSWLTWNELEKVLSDFKLEPDQQTPTFQAALAALRVLAARYGGDHVRIVYCFDG